MAPPDWLHCNKCYTRFNENIQFFISECGHVICATCAKAMGMANASCVVCKTNTSLLLLSKDLRPDILEYFQPINIFLDKANKIVKFQFRNMNLILSNLLSKYNFAKTELLKTHKMLNLVKMENSKLKAMLMAKREQPGFTTSTPAMKMQRGQSSRQNSSLFTLESSPRMFNSFSDPMMGYKASPVVRNDVVPTHGSNPGNRNSTLGSLSMAQMSLGRLKPGYGTSFTSN